MSVRAGKLPFVPPHDNAKVIGGELCVSNPTCLTGMRKPGMLVVSIPGPVVELRPAVRLGDWGTS